MLSNTDVQSAIPAITEILKRDDPAALGDQPKAPKPDPKPLPQEVEREEPEDEEIDAGADDGDDIDLDDEDTAPAETEPKAPAVEPPSGLTADEKELFRNSPPEVQKAWARREQDRSRELRRLQNEQADLRKIIESEKQALNAERSALSQQMSKYGNQLVQKFQKDYADVKNPVELAQNDPVRFTQFQAALLEIQAVEQETRVAQEAEKREFQAKLGSFRTEQNDILKERLKLDTQEKFDKFDSEITEFLTSQGVSMDRIARAGADELEMAYDAMRYRRALAKRKTSEKTKEVPQYVKPGNKSDISASDQSRSVSMKRLKKSGSIADAAAVFKGIIS